MVAGLEVPLATEADRVTTALLADLSSGGHRRVVVDSLLRAGKSTRVICAAAELVAVGESLIIAVHNNEWVDDLKRPPCAKAPALRMGRLRATDYPANTNACFSM